MKTILELVSGFFSAVWLVFRLLLTWLLAVVVAPVVTFFGLILNNVNAIPALFVAFFVWLLGCLVAKTIFPDHFPESWTWGGGGPNYSSSFTPTYREEDNPPHYYGDEEEDEEDAIEAERVDTEERDRMRRMRESHIQKARERASLGMVDPPKKERPFNMATLPTQQEYVRHPAGYDVQHTYGPGPTGSVIVQDGAGRIQAIKEAPTSQGVTVVRGPSGVLEGKIEMRPDGSGTVYDSAGRYQTLIEKPVRSGSSIKTTYRDASQRLIGTKEVTDSGRTEYRKASGALCGPDFK